MDVRVDAWSDVQVADGRDTVKAVLECSKGRGLWEEHEQPIETFVKMRVSVGLEELYAKICSSY
jgi:hypothetical protein